MNLDVTIHVGIVTLAVYIPGARSLKDKRSVLKGLKDRLRSRFNLSVAEVGDGDHWQSATLALSLVSRDLPYLEGAVAEVTTYLGSIHAVQIVATRVEYL